MRDIRLHPLPKAKHDCPHCRQSLRVRGWYIPGMRNLADLNCENCGREFYGDIAAGQALYTPMLLAKTGGEVHDGYGVPWFADWLRDSYANRTEIPVSFEVEKRLPITRQVVLLNCLDTLYGHSLLKLLNAQYHLERNVDLILMIPSMLAWMVPEGVAEVWKIGLPLKRGTEWNDWLGREVKLRVEAFESASLSLALSHPKPEDFEIERFTRVTPFPLEQWDARLVRPTVTFIWRDDRTWSTSHSISPGRVDKGKRTTNTLSTQQQWVVELAGALRSKWPALDFAIVGLSEVKSRGHLPTWIQDLRFRTMDVDQERHCCERYASSHVVVGVHGSNMLLPTAHAGGLVELLDTDRWGNFTQDVLFRDARDCRETLFRYRFVPPSTSPNEIANLVSLLLRGRGPFIHLMNVESNDVAT